MLRFSVALRFSALGLAFSLMAVACGQKGPLSLPEPPPQPQPQPAKVSPPPPAASAPAGVLR